jgi:hypothetical protein
VDFRYIMAFVLVLINAIHFMVINFFEIPGNFYETAIEHYETELEIIYYGIAILSTFCYPMIARKISLKYTLITALLCDLLGLFMIWLCTFTGGTYIFALLATLFKATAFLTVTISAITYLVLEFPKTLIASIMALFAFGDVGGILANLLFTALTGTQYGIGFFLLSTVLLVGLIWYIAATFLDPQFPKHLQKLRKGSLIWKEFHYRLAFFLLAGICYGFTESVFSGWSEIYLLKFLPQDFVTATVSLYWLAMLVGKFILLIPAYFLPVHRLFPLLIMATIGSIIFIQGQSQFTGVLLGFGLAGISLAAVMPIIIGTMEGEIITSSKLSHRNNYLPFIESGTALIIGSHFCGVGLMSLYLQFSTDIASLAFFHWAILIAAAIGLIVSFLHWSGNGEPTHG